MDNLQLIAESENWYRAIDTKFKPKDEIDMNDTFAVKLWKAQKLYAYITLKEKLELTVAQSAMRDQREKHNFIHIMDIIFIFILKLLPCLCIQLLKINKGKHEVDPPLARELIHTPMMGAHVGLSPQRLDSVCRRCRGGSAYSLIFRLRMGSEYVLEHVHLGICNLCGFLVTIKNDWFPSL